MIYTVYPYSLSLSFILRSIADGSHLWE